MDSESLEEISAAIFIMSVYILHSASEDLQDSGAQRADDLNIYGVEAGDRDTLLRL